MSGAIPLLPLYAFMAQTGTNLPFSKPPLSCNNSLQFRGSYGIIKCLLKVAVHLQKLLEVMSTSVRTGLNPFNFIRKHFL